MKWQEAGENCINESPIICTVHQIIIRVVKSKRMRWAGHVARMGDLRSAYNILFEKPEGREHSEHLGVGGRIILK
jgi:hypothetical protein